MFIGGGRRFSSSNANYVPFISQVDLTLETNTCVTETWKISLDDTFTSYDESSMPNVAHLQLDEGQDLLYGGTNSKQAYDGGSNDWIILFRINMATDTMDAA